MEIAWSARKHQAENGFSDADINHVVEHALYAANDDDEPDMVLYLGPTRQAVCWTSYEKTSRKWRSMP